MSKKSPRHLSRSLAIQGIYHHKLNQTDTKGIKEFLIQSGPDLYLQADNDLMQNLLEQGIAKYDEMLSYFIPYLERNIDDINLIEQAILVVAAIELVNNLNVPTPVIINEAIELGKLYGGPDSYKFINNIVDKLAKQLRPDEIKHYTKK